MAGENKSKLNRLLRAWPAGTVAVVPWLTKRGVYQQLAYEYERSGWLRRVGRGAYVRLGDEVDWPGAVYALQAQLGLKLHVGGKSALEIKGLGHFAQVGGGGYVYLFGSPNRKPPAWFSKHKWSRRVAYRMPRLFGRADDRGLSRHSFGTFELIISSPERAMLEVLHLVPSEQTAEEALLLMESLVTLRPSLVQELLERCQSVKVKRLFLALAERCHHPWVEKLETKRIKLGKGKRVVVRGGVLDPKYQITLPKPEAEQGAEGK